MGATFLLTKQVKRIILTGFPVGVNKRAAVVRRMFYNAEDIKWFKPVELWTKYGLVGHIKEARGTKGRPHMHTTCTRGMDCKHEALHAHVC